MATRQYIGARYVPKFFSGEGGSTEWVSGVQYEPLTIVTHLGNSYTSKKPVPVGIDILNTEYWASTGLWNSQVEQYKEEVDELSETFDKYNGITKKRNILLIGDSYMRGDQATTDTIESVIISSVNATTYNYSYGGTGFVTGGSHDFNHQITDAADDNNLDNTIITDVVIAGGYNDSLSTTYAEFVTAVNAIVSNVKENFENATIWFVPMLWTNGTYSIDWRKKHLNLVNACKQTGCNVYADANILLYRRSSDYISSDGVHPTSLGYKVIGDYISSWLNGTYLTPEYGDAYNIELSGGESATFYYRVKNGRVTVKVYFYSAQAYGVDQNLFSDLPNVVKPANALPFTAMARSMTNSPVNIGIGATIYSVTSIPVNANITLFAEYPFDPYMY